MILNYVFLENGKIKNFWPSVISGTYAAVRWKLDCVDTIGLIKEYNLMICPLESICINSECIGKLIFINIHKCYE